MAENFKTADVIGVFVRENNAVELPWCDAALLQTQHDLPRAQTAINENLAMVGGEQRAVSRAPAPEHGEAEHGFKVIRVISFCANGNGENEDDIGTTSNYRRFRTARNRFTY